jgi:hypothetical protein
VAGDVMRKKVNLLLSVRRKIKDNMTVSGTHNNNVYDYLDTAMNSVKSARGRNNVAVYYFYCRCEEHEDIDSKYSTFLDVDA